MPEQLSLLAALRESPLDVPVDPDGPVVQGEIDELHVLPHPKGLAWNLAKIELHQAGNGYWMWGVKHPNGGFRVGEKWGRFAVTRYDALFYGARELIATVHRDCEHRDRVIAWACRIAEISEKDLVTA